MTKVIKMPIEIIEYIFLKIGRSSEVGPKEAYNFMIALGSHYFGPTDLALKLHRYKYKKYGSISSLKYYNDQNYRTNENNSIVDPFNQISLYLYNCSEITTLDNISRVHTLNLGYCKNIVDVSCLENVYDLMLNGCFQLKNFSNLGKVHRLDLVNCNIEQVDQLSNVHTLNLSKCYRAKVNKLNCHKLYLNGCAQVENVSNLGGCHELDLSGCILIDDVSRLASVHTLILDGCRNITDVSMLGRCHELDLSKCKKITDVSNLGGVHTLNLSSTNISDVSMLGHCHTLNLKKCYNLTNIRTLGNVFNLNTNWCLNIKKYNK
jgi:hypothetical protein